MVAPARTGGCDPRPPCNETMTSPVSDLGRDDLGDSRAGRRAQPARLDGRLPGRPEPGDPLASRRLRHRMATTRPPRPTERAESDSSAYTRRPARRRFRRVRSGSRAARATTTPSAWAIESGRQICLVRAVPGRGVAAYRPVLDRSPGRPGNAADLRPPARCGARPPWPRSGPRAGACGRSPGRPGRGTRPVPPGRAGSAPGHPSRPAGPCHLEERARRRRHRCGATPGSGNSSPIKIVSGDRNTSR